MERGGRPQKKILEGRGLIMVNSWSMIVELALDHGRPWSFRGLSTMKGPSFDHGHYMVDDGHGTAD